MKIIIVEYALAKKAKFLHPICITSRQPMLQCWAHILYNYGKYDFHYLIKAGVVMTQTILSTDVRSWQHCCFCNFPFFWCRVTSADKGHAGLNRKGSWVPWLFTDKAQLSRETGLLQGTAS